MLMTIITVVKNGEATIGRTISSVISQSYKNIQYIIVDGESTDNTSNIIKGFLELNNNIFYINSPDSGMYSALNKGYSYSEGDFVGILNADDYYTDRTYIEKVSKYLLRNYVDILQTDCAVWDVTTGKTYLHKSTNPSICKLMFTGSLLNNPHTSLFFSKKVVHSEIKYDTNLKCSSDYKYLYLNLLLNRYSTAYYNISGIIFTRNSKNLSSTKQAISENKALIAELKHFRSFFLVGKLIFLYNNPNRIWQKLSFALTTFMQLVTSRYTEKC